MLTEEELEKLKNLNGDQYDRKKETSAGLDLRTFRIT